MAFWKKKEVKQSSEPHTEKASSVAQTPAQTDSANVNPYSDQVAQKQETDTSSTKQQNEKPQKDDQTRTLFHLEKAVFPESLPSAENKESINVRYPLIPPYAYAHLHWSTDENELVYEVIEPELTNAEEELLKLIQLGLEEMINISYMKLQKSQLILTYLEKAVQSILMEIGTKISKDAYMKIMYYIYRDFVGLNKVEPLLNDQYIEDIECNGIDFPLYVVHRKYENLKTNIVFKDETLKDFVEKIAQKTGRYISYAKPILDGTLPDGSRVNATYTDDVTTRGPTFTIRKFTKDPWTPVYLSTIKTADTRLFAFFWLVIQYKFNIMVIGETASGKTTFLNAISQFIPPEARICSVEDTRELNLAHNNWLPAVTREGFGIPSLEGKTAGSISLFDLLRETFRQNPDYVILGETRGQETSVLFQGMASGHPSLSTFHAASPEMLVKRLETPPINLPASLIESLDIICSITHVKTQDKNYRRVSQLAEVNSVKAGELGNVSYNTVFKWNPQNDTLDYLGKSLLFQKISRRTGMTPDKLEEELTIRTRILDTMIEKGITAFPEFTSLVKLFYKDKQELLDKLGIRQ